MKPGFVLLAAALFCGVGPGTAPAETPMPFQPGERLVFEARWGIIPAGEAVLEVLPNEPVGGVQARHFLLTTRTYPYIDVFYKIRNRIDAFTDIDMGRSLFFSEKRTGHSPKDVEVTFDWEANQVQYADFGEKRKAVDVQPGSLDPFSVFYAFRFQELKEGTVLTRPVTDGKKCILGTVRVVRRERLKCAMGEIDTFLVEPSLEHIGGVFEKAKDAKIQIWVSADRYRVPVRIKSKVIVGSFVAELIEVAGTDWREGQRPAVSRPPQSIPPR